MRLCGQEDRPISRGVARPPPPRFHQAIDLVTEVHGMAEGLGMRAKSVEVRPRGTAASGGPHHLAPSPAPQRAAKAWLLFLRGALKHNLSPSHVVSDLERIGAQAWRPRRSTSR